VTRLDYEGKIRLPREW